MDDRELPELSEIELLRARLEEAEQTLDAIRSGHVDALIISGPEGERIFTLEGADHRYRVLVEGMTEGAVILSAEGVVLYANRSFAGLVQAPLDRVLGSHFADFVAEASRSAFAGLLKRAEERPEVGDTTLSTGDARSVAVRISAAADPELAHGGLCLIVTDLSQVLRDMQARMDAETALSGAQERERQVRELVDNLPELAWNARPDGFIDFYNHRWYEYTGTSPEQMAGWGWTSVHDPEYLPTVIAHWRACIESGEPFEMEFPLRAADGEFRWFLTRVRALRDERGQIVRWFGMNTDIDDARRERQRVKAMAQALAEAVEARTRALDEAERVSHAKDEFLATMSHELRTPLNAMLGWAGMLQSGTVDADKVGHGIAVIERNARAQARLVDDLLDVSRIISGKLHLTVQNTELAAVIYAAVDVVRQAAEAKDIELRVFLAADLGSLMVDPDRLQQVVWNLLSNAVKFTPAAGQVTVSAERSGARIQLRVTDTGIGIGAEHLPFVFERLRQVDGTSTRAHGGMGLGLAIVRHLVEAHGGTVTAQSAGADAGSCFTVELPVRAVDTTLRAPSLDRAPQPSVPPSSTAHTAQPLRGASVLVVEDDADSMELLRTVLEGAGASVVLARRAIEALDKTAHTHFDVIVSDIGMPELDGYGFMRQLRARATGGDIPAIALTAYARVEDATASREAGYQEHMTKPIDIARLLAAVSRYAAGPADS